ncbi:MAG: TetR/AcrR family transcriptional regulator [Ilumatobacteraceae bacterium]
MSAPERREQILSVALQAFARAGYHNTSMNDIAEQLGVTKPVLYQYFDSKRALYLELLDHVGRDLVSHVTRAAAAAGDNGRQKTVNGMVAYFTWVDAHREAFSLVFESSGRVDEEFADIVKHFEDAAAAAIAPFITAPVSAEDQRTFALGLVGMAEAVSRHLIAQHARFDAERVGIAIAGLAWAGLRSVGAEPRA